MNSYLATQYLQLLLFRPPAFAKSRVDVSMKDLTPNSQEFLPLNQKIVAVVSLIC